MKTETTIRVVIFREGDQYIAQGLEVDICTQGRTPEVASTRFGIALNAEANEANEQGKSLFEAIEPAPENFHRLYESGEAQRWAKDLPEAA